MDFIDEFLNKEELTVEDLEKLEKYTRELEKKLGEEEAISFAKAKIKEDNQKKYDYMNNWFQMNDKEKSKEAKHKIKKLKKMPNLKGLHLKNITIKLR